MSGCQRCRQRSVWYPDVYCRECEPIVEAERAAEAALLAEVALVVEDAAMMWPRVVHKGAHR